MWQKIYSLLFDTSAGRKQARGMYWALQTALSESETDEGFRQCYLQAVTQATGMAEHQAWGLLSRQLLEYQEGNMEFPLRVLARRYAEDLRRRYRLS